MENIKLKSLFVKNKTLHPSFNSIFFDFGLFDTFKHNVNVIGGLEEPPLDTNGESRGTGLAKG